MASDPTAAAAASSPSNIDPNAKPTIDAPVLAALSAGIKIESGTLDHAELAFAALVKPGAPAAAKAPEVSAVSALAAAIQPEPAIASQVTLPTVAAPNKLVLSLGTLSTAVQPETVPQLDTAIAVKPQVADKPPVPPAEVLPATPVDTKPQTPSNPPFASPPVKSDVAAVTAASAPAFREETRDGNSNPHSAPETILAPAQASPVNSAHTDAEPAAHAPVTHAPEIQSEPATTKNEPMRDIALKLTNQDAERVEVRLSERSGELRVAVRSADPVLTRDLRSGLGDLVGRLERGGFRTETWQPAGTDQRTTTHTARQSQDFQGGGSGDPNRQQARQDAPGQQRNRRRDQPKWLQEMQNNLNPTEPTRKI